MRLTQNQLFETTRTFFGKALRVDARRARATLKSASTNFHQAVVRLDLGARHFEVDINRNNNSIRLVEISTHKKFRFDSRNLLHGYFRTDVRNERVICTEPLDRYLPNESK